MSKKIVTGTAQTEVKAHKENLKYQFNDTEKLAIGANLAEQKAMLDQLLEDQKQASAEWKARIAAGEASLSGLARAINNGYEYRDIKCEIVINDPVGRKTCRRLDTYETVWVKDLTDDEKQRTLELEVE